MNKVERFVICVNDPLAEKQFIGIDHASGGYPYAVKAYDDSMLFCNCHIRDMMEYCYDTRDQFVRIGINPEKVVIRDVTTGKDISVAANFDMNGKEI